MRAQLARSALERMGHTHTRLCRAGVIAVLLSTLCHGCNASCDVSDFDVVVSDVAENHEAWLTKLRAAGKRPLHMNFYQASGAWRFNGISIPNSNADWILDPGTAPMSYKRTYCVKWQSEYPYKGTSVAKMYTLMETCDKAFERRSAERPVYIAEQVNDMHAKGYVMTSLTKTTSGKSKELWRHEAFSATRMMPSTYCKCIFESAVSKPAIHTTHPRHQLQRKLHAWMVHSCAHMLPIAVYATRLLTTACCYLTSIFS
jgi:hypothetical protein